MPRPLPPDVQNRLDGLVTVFRGGARDGLACPSCGSDQVTVEDRSTRPYAEWYVVACPACGFDRTVQIPMGWRPPVAD